MYSKRPTSEKARKVWDWAEANLGTLASMQLQTFTSKSDRGFSHEWTFFLTDGRRIKRQASEIPTRLS